MNVIIVTITYINGDYDNFDIYTSNDTSNDTLYASNINKTHLISGYQIINAPIDTTKIKLISTSSGCNGNITIIDIESNHIYVEKISNVNYKIHIRLITVPDNGPYNIIFDNSDHLTLLITNNIGTYIESIDLSNNTQQTSFYFTNNILNIEHEINGYTNITNISYSNLNIKIYNGSNIHIYEFDSNVLINLNITNTEILNSTKNYINIKSTIL